MRKATISPWNMQRTKCKRYGYLFQTKFSFPTIDVFLFSLNITVTSQLVSWRLKSPAYGLFAQFFVQAHIKENIKAPRHWHLWGESISVRWIPLKIVTQKVFPFDDVIMISLECVPEGIQWGDLTGDKPLHEPWKVPWCNGATLLHKYFTCHWDMPIFHAYGINCNLNHILWCTSATSCYISLYVLLLLHHHIHLYWIHAQLMYQLIVFRVGKLQSQHG